MFVRITNDCVRITNTQLVKITKVEDTRKYTIKEKFDALPWGERADKIAEACEAMEISDSQLRKIWSYKKGEPNEAKPSQLLALANVLGCSIEDLFFQEAQELG